MWIDLCQEQRGRRIAVISIQIASAVLMARANAQKRARASALLDGGSLVGHRVLAATKGKASEFWSGFVAAAAVACGSCKEL